MYLEMAENPVDVKALYEYYIPVEDNQTGEVQFIREDLTDNMSDLDFQRLMSESSAMILRNAEVNPEYMGILGFGKKAKERRQQRREKRQKKQERKAAIKDARAKRKIEGNTWADRALGVVGKVLGGATPAERDPQGLTVTYDDTIQKAEPEKKWYQNPVVIVGGVAVVGLAIWALTSKKKR